MILQAKCVCREGFWGNGNLCYDINECKFANDVLQTLKGDEKLSSAIRLLVITKHICFVAATVKKHTLLGEAGLPCGHGARCVNTLGSFECHCLPGFVKVHENDRQCNDMIAV